MREKQLLTVYKNESSEGTPQGFSKFENLEIEILRKIHATQ